MRKTLAVLTLLVAPSLAAAQNAAAVPMPKNVISIQPLSAMFTVLAAEYERKGGAAWTWGVGVTNFSPDGEDGNSSDVNYSSGDLKFRYYPQSVALQGFSFGGSVGFTKVSAEDPNTTPPTDESASGGTFGVLLEYQWLLGAKKKFAVALGVGAKMLTISEEDITNSDFIARYPTARVSVGYAW